jgi:predicted nucleic acid-binding protein
MSQSVMVDTSFLITLANPNYPNYDAANRYFKYCLNPAHDIKLHLSSIVVAEYHQGASALPWLKSGNFVSMPFNILDATHVSVVAHNLGLPRNPASTDLANPAIDGRAEFKDDLKLIAQAEKNKIDFIITEDRRTLAKYVEDLHQAGFTSVRAIVVADGYEVSCFTGGQASLPLDDEVEAESDREEE